jgi:hypothetical protein
MKKVEFRNGIVLEVGANYEDGIILDLAIEDDCIKVICVDGKEGWTVLFNENGEIVEEE